jgi:prolyl oligopeptidase
VLRLALHAPTLERAATIVPQSDAAIESLVATRTRLYTVDQVGGPSRVRVLNLKGEPQTPVELPPISAVHGVVPLDGDDVLIRYETYTEPPAWYRLSAAAASGSAGASLSRTALAATSPADFSDTVVVREIAKSKDGTRIPITILWRKGTKLDGRNPTLLYGYGGYGISTSPSFVPRLRVWLEQGGVYAVANIRGGGEFGEEWHRAGNLTNKQNVFDDFAASMQYLIDAHYTSRDKLAIMGGSNGGLLMGAMLTQHPDLCKAVVSSVGIYDMLRVEQTPNGAFNVTEFGTVKNPDQFRAMLAYSPYQHVTDRTAYPAVLFITGQNDPRVDPYHSRKMAARLQAATSSNAPILLRTSANAGHGIGSSLNERIEQYVDIYAFLFHELGVDYKPVGSASP